jgi:lipid-A-disaccharide synthase-like uncharacterized protein
MTIKLLGWAGSAVVIVAYWPQIHHLCVEKCAWGLSITTWVLWLVSSLLLLTYAIMLGDALFICVQAINIAAIVTTIILAKRGDTVCPSHLAEAEARAAKMPDHD